MKRILLLAALMICAPFSFAGAAYVQSVNNSVSSTTLTTLATTIAATKLHSLVVVAFATDGANALTVTDTSVTDGTNTYSQVVTQTQSGSINERASLWAASNVSAGITSITVNISGALGSSGAIQVIIAEYSGVDTGSVASITNTTATNSNAGSTTPSVSITPTANTITVATNNSSTVSKADGTIGFALRQNPAGANGYSDNLRTVSGTYTPTFKLAASDNWAMVAASFTVSSSFNAGVTDINDQWGLCNGSQGNINGSCTATVVPFRYTALQANDGVLFALGCPGTPTVVSLAASGWTITQIGGIIGSGPGGWGALFKAYSPNTSTGTFTATWTGGTCTTFGLVSVAEFAGEDQTNFVDASNSGTNVSCALTVTPVSSNDTVWFWCIDSVTAVAGSFIKGTDDTTGDWSEWKTIVGSSATASSFTGSTPDEIWGVAIKPASAAPLLNMPPAIL